MKTYSRDKAIIVLNENKAGCEIYGWPTDFDKSTTFAFVVIYRGRKREGWWVALHHKLAVDPDKTYFECIDELQSVGPTMPYGSSERHEFPTAEQAVDFALSEYSLSEFMDHATITQKYKNRYLES